MNIITLSFSAFDIQHLIAIFLYIFLPLFLIIRFRDKIKVSKYEKYIRYGILIFTFSLEFWYYISHIIKFDPIVTWFPLDFCVVVLYLGAYGLIFRSDKLYTLHFIMLYGFFLSYMAPAITVGIDSIRFHHFFVVHAFHLVSFIYMYNVFEFRPKRSEILRSSMILLCISVFFMLSTNVLYNFGFTGLLDANYWYFLQPPVDGVVVYDFTYNVSSILYGITWILSCILLTLLLTRVKVFTEDK